MALGDGIGGDGESGGLVHKLENLTALQDLFQVAGFISAATKAGKGALVKPKGKGAFGLDELLVYSNEPIPASLLKLSADNVTRAIQMFNFILSYQGETAEKLNDAQRVDTVQKLMHQGLKRPELRDELYMQLIKQTRGNTGAESRLRAWELFNLVAATMPPSKEFIGLVSAFVSTRALDDGELPNIQRLSERAWNSLKRTSRAGPRRTLPAAEEINACIKDAKLSTIVFFMDDTFDNLDYDLTTTVQEGTGVLAAHINLEHYKTFTIFECRRITPQKGMEAPEDQFFLLDENRYIADILVDLKAKNDKNGKEATNKLVFKKRMFRHDDHLIDEYQHTSLCYLQCQHDFVQGHYPVVKEDAAQMCALQMSAEHSSSLLDDDTGIMGCVEKYVTKQVLMTRPRDEWLMDVSARYKAISDLSKEEARVKFLQTLRMLPYGQSIFFPCKKVEDPVGLLPPKLIISVNFRGVHFFRPSPKEYLHSAELKDVVQFGSSSTALFLKVRVAEVPHVFQFETKQGGEVCHLLKTHINEIMTKRYQKYKADGIEPDDERTVAKKEEVKIEQHLAQLQKALEDSQNLVDQLAKNNDELRYSKEKLLAEIEDTTMALKREQESRDELQEQAKNLEKIVQANKQEIEVNKAKAKAAEQAANAAGAELAAIDTAHFAQLEELLVERTEQANKMAEKKAEIEKRIVNLTKEKETLDAKLKRVEKTTEAENKELRAKLDGVTGNVKSTMQEKDAKLNELAEELAAAQNQLNDAQTEIGKFKNDGQMMEMQEILEMQAEVERKAKQNAHILEEQAKRIAEIEKSYRDECLRRKGLFNQLEDIRGKLRVYCRVRPPTGSETSVITCVDQTVNVKGKEFQFDSVFGPEAEQEIVFDDCKHCVQSAMEGFNVSLFGIGAPGSGRTHTFNGTKDQPGLAPRFADEFFRLVDKSKGKTTYKISFSMVQLNSDTLIDLLLPAAKRGKPTKMDIRKDGMRGIVLVTGATTAVIRDAAHLKKVLDYGEKANAATKEAGKSTLVMTFVVDTVHATSGAIGRGKLMVVDVASIEKAKGNKNITALNNVVNALNEGQEHIPYKDSKLTMLLADALGGTAKSVVMVNVSPADGDVEETLNIFDLAGRMHKVKNAIKKLDDSKDLQKLLKQVDYWMQQAGLPDKELILQWAALEEIECAREQEETGP